MKRFVKMFFSRLFVYGLTIILMTLVFAVLFWGLFNVAEVILSDLFPDYEILFWLGFGGVEWIILVATVLNIVNRDMIPETKIPWTICVIVFGLVGVAIYIIFSNNKPSRRQRANYQLLNERSRPFLGRTVSEKTRAEQMGRWAQVSEALHRSNRNAVLRGNTKTEYFPLGEQFFTRYLKDLKNAKRFIFMEYFILAKGKMWDSVLAVLEEKVKEGVEVRVSYDDIGCMGKLRSGYYRILRKKGIRCVKFNPFVPLVSNYHNNRDHRKITVIDGVIGYTGGLNLADEYINETAPFGHWKDTAIRLEGEGVTGLTLMFLRLFNLRAREPENFEPYIPPAESFPAIGGEGFVQPYGDGPRPLYDRQVAEDLYINVLTTAEKYVYIMSPYLIIDHRLEGALLLAAARGVDVRIIVPHIPDKKLAFALARSNYMKLIKGGVKIYEYTPGFIHAKNFLADDVVGIVGTINLDYRSLLHHYENAVFMYRTKAVAQLKEDFLTTFSLSRLQTEEDAKKRVVRRVTCEIAKVFAPLF